MVTSNISTINVSNTLNNLIFDGSFKLTDVPHAGYGSGGSQTGFGDVWDGWYCLPQSDSLIIIPAPRRQGYAAKFTCHPGSAYDCGGNQHNQISYHARSIPNPNRDVWYGWSSMYDSTWQPNNGDTFTIVSFSSSSYYYQTGNTGLNFMQEGTSDYLTLILSGDRFNILDIPPLSIKPDRNIWYDWMFHVYYDRTPTGPSCNGFIQIYIRKEGESNYTLLWEKYNVQTEYPWATPETNYFMPRVGIYRGSSSTTIQIMYFYNPKIGTTRQSVEYNG